MIEPHKETIKDYTFQMLPVEGGTFLMGSPDNDKDALEWEHPQHEVMISSFLIGRFPVTQTLWKAVMDGQNPSFFHGDDLPVEQVSWEDITQDFLPALRHLTGFSYRLPTEAEWEYAARGGKYHPEGYKYAGSDNLKEVGWFVKNSNGRTNSVGLKSPNQLGIYDMSGNVWEWCSDWYDSNKYYEKCKEQGIVKDPPGSESGTQRIARGGFWILSEKICRSAYRNADLPDTRSNRFGFRLALSLPLTGKPDGVH